MESVPSIERQAVREAAEWLAGTASDQRPHPVVPAVRQRFGLTAHEACRAIREASLIQARSN